MMKRWLVGFFTWCAVNAYADGVLPPLPSSSAVPDIEAGVLHTVVAKPVGALPRVHGGMFDLRFVNVGQVVDLIYDDALKVPHVISSDVLQDPRLVSFQFDTSKGDLRTFVLTFLDSLGFKVETRDGVDFVSVKSGSGKSQSERDVFVYRVKHRHASELSSMVQSLFGARASMPSAAANPVSGAVAASAPNVSAEMSSPAANGNLQLTVTAGTSDDEVVVSGSARDVAMVRKILPDLDTSIGEVVVRGWAYEVDDTNDTNLGFNVASKLLGVGVSLGAGSTSSDSNALQFGAGRLSFAISALNADSRFKEVSSPNVRCVSGEQVKLNVGQQVPTVSAISYQGTSGTPVQSIEYQDAGVIFSVLPTVMEDTIQLKIDEEISSFASTTTGVNGSPTKSTRSLQTVADLKDGEVIVLGGLIQDQTASSRSGEGFLPAFLDGRSKSKARTEVVLVIQVEKI